MVTRALWLRSTRALAAAVVLLGGGLLGCGGGLAVTKVASVRAAPSNLAVLVSVERDGKPVTGLEAQQFTIFEDGAPLSAADTHVSLQPVAESAVTHTLVLVDRSSAGVRALSGDALVAAVEPLVARAGKLGQVAVAAYDGDDAIHPIVPFTDDASKVDLSPLAAYQAKDASTNLYGAVLAGLDAVDKSLADEALPLRFGALVLVAAGPDLAARKSRDDVTRALDDARFANVDVLAVGVGPAAAEAKVDDLGRTKAKVAGAALPLTAAVEQTAHALESRWKSYYLLSYCTPARAGEHKVRVEVHPPSGAPTGSIEYAFKADGMGPGCDATVPPKFVGFDVPGERLVRDTGAPPAAAPPSGGGGPALKVALPAAVDVSVPGKVSLGGALSIATRAVEKADKGEKKGEKAERGDKGEKDKAGKGEAKKGDAKAEKKAEGKKDEKKPAPKKEEKKPAAKKAAPSKKK
ncbi:MAG TPA: hypothetical protein VHB21_26040 [Minicystis sp.]|nr:hypothetical protein [Minicystis sp.]